MRICKLLHYGAKPVFVFDGKAPLLKSATVARRRRAYELQIVNHEKAARKLLLQQQHQQQLQSMSTTATITTTTTVTPVTPTVQQQSSTQTPDRTRQQIDWGDFIFDDDEEERSMDKINAEVLMELPEEVRKELLEDSHYAKRKRKRERLAAPSSPADFCARQLNQLVASSSSLSKKTKSSSPAVKTSGHINSQDQGREYLLLRKTDDDRSRVVDTEKPTKSNIDYRTILLPPRSPQSQLYPVSRVDVLALKNTPLLLDVDKDESAEDDEEWEEVRADVIATSPATPTSKTIENAAARRRSRWQSFLSQASPSIPRNGLEEVQKEMREEVSHLSVLARQQQQHVASQTDEVIKECQQLLRLFGVPFLRAPSEAEAQCAYLESQSLVDAVISDDSDTFLFGGNRVFRNIFDKVRLAPCFKMLSDCSLSKRKRMRNCTRRLSFEVQRSY